MQNNIFFRGIPPGIKNIGSTCWWSSLYSAIDAAILYSENEKIPFGRRREIIIPTPAEIYSATGLNVGEQHCALDALYRVIERKNLHSRFDFISEQKITCDCCGTESIKDQIETHLAVRAENLFQMGSPEKVSRECSCGGQTAQIRRRLKSVSEFFLVLVCGSFLQNHHEKVKIGGRDARLVSRINYSGSGFSGHYTAHVLREDVVYFVNDSEVRISSFAEQIFGSSFILFYCAKDFPRNK